MNSLFVYKSYSGSMEYSEEDRCFFGKVKGVKCLISYEGASRQDLKCGFEAAVDDYLADCRERGLEPELPSDMI